MNTKTDGISSGLVAVAWSYISPLGTVRKLQDRQPCLNNPEEHHWTPLVRLSDAEAIIAQKDAEILEQCRINGIGAERELALLGQIERQSAALKLAKSAMDQIDWDVRLGGYADGFTETWALMDKALATINEVLKGE